MLEKFNPLVEGAEQLKIVEKKTEYDFDIVEDGLYFIEIIASAKNWLQNWKRLFDDDDLAVKIDDIKFPKLNGKAGLLNGETAWNGNNLKGLKKINVFIVHLESGQHKIQLIADQNPCLESIKISKMENENRVEYAPADENKQAQDGNNRQWINFVFTDLPIKNIKISAKAEKREKDRDDIKLIIDGAIQENADSEYFKNWYWYGSLDDGEEKTYEKEVNLQKGLHYIELWADRMPTLKEVKIVLEEHEENKDAEQEKPQEEIKSENKVQIYDQFHGIGGKEDYNRFDNKIIEAVDYWNDFFAKQEYPPEELLDYNLVKAIIYKESRVGYLEVVEGRYLAYPDVMQVGDTNNPALATLREKEGYNAYEFISKDKRVHLSYSFPKEWLPVKVETAKESIFWGVRWLYFKAQKQYGTSSGDKPPYIREWKTWKQAVIDYNGSDKKHGYQRLIWQIYKNGIDPDGNTLWEKIKGGFSLIWIIAITSIILLGTLTCCYAANKLYKSYCIQENQEDKTNITKENDYYDSGHNIDSSHETRMIVEQVFLENLEEYKKYQYHYGDIFDATVEECRKRHCWMEIVVHGHYNGLVENIRSNKQFLDAVKVFDFWNPKVGDIDNDGENEVVFVRKDILNHDFIVISIIDKINGQFRLIEKQIAAYDGRIELKDLTGDLIPEIVAFISFGRYGYPLFIYQYENAKMAQIFNDEYIEYPEYTFSDLDDDGKMEIRVIGEESKAPRDYHIDIKRVYEYDSGRNSFILIDSEITEI